MEPRCGHWALAVTAALLLHAGIVAFLWQPAPSGAGAGRAGGIVLALAGGGDAAGEPDRAPAASVDAAAGEPEREPAEVAEMLPEAVAAIEVAPEPAEAPVAVAQPVEMSEALEVAAPPLEPAPEIVETAALPEPELVVVAEVPSFAPPLAKPRRPPVVAERSPAAAAQPAPASGTIEGAATTAAGEAAHGDAGTGPLAAEPGSGVAGAVPVGGGEAADAMDHYVAALQAWLERHKDYPRGARVRRQTGTAMLQFVMDRSGKVVEHHLAASSGHELLDRAVIAMLERAQPLPPMPDGLRQDRLEVVLPVQFAMH